MNPLITIPLPFSSTLFHLSVGYGVQHLNRKLSRYRPRSWANISFINPTSFTFFSQGHFILYWLTSWICTFFYASLMCILYPLTSSSTCRLAPSLISPLLGARFCAEVEIPMSRVIRCTQVRPEARPSTRRLPFTLSSRDCGWQMTPVRDEPSSDNKQHIENTFLWPWLPAPGTGRHTTGVDAPTGSPSKAHPRARTTNE